MKTRILLNPESQGGGGSQAQTPSGTSEIDSNAQRLFGQQGQQTQQSTQQSTPGAGEPQGGNTTAPANQPGMTPMQITPAMLAEALKQAGVGAQAQPAAQQPPPMTEEEFRQKFHVFDMDDDLLAGISDEDPAKRKAAYNELSKRVVRNSLAIAQHLMQQQMGEFSSQYEPVRKFYTEAQAERLKGQFFTKHADLKGYETLVDMAATQLQASGFKGSIEEAFDKVATSVRSLVKNLPGVGQGQQQQQQQQQRPATSQMSTVLAGGQSGAGGGQQAAQANGRQVNPIATRLFGPRR